MSSPRTRGRGDEPLRHRRCLGGGVREEVPRFELAATPSAGSVRKGFIDEAAFAIAKRTHDDAVARYVPRLVALVPPETW